MWHTYSIMCFIICYVNMSVLITTLLLIFSLCLSTDVDGCKSNPCLNGGSCRGVMNVYTCNCPFAFYGTICQQSKNCTDEVIPAQHLSIFTEIFIYRLRRLRKREGLENMELHQQRSSVDWILENSHFHKEQ